MVFAQVMARVPHWEFRRLAQAHDPAHGRRQFSSWDHFLALAFAQMTFRESLRDIEACLSTEGLAYHLGFRTRITRATLARANAHDCHASCGAGGAPNAVSTKGAVGIASKPGIG